MTNLNNSYKTVSSSSSISNLNVSHENISNSPSYSTSATKTTKKLSTKQSDSYYNKYRRNQKMIKACNCPQKMKQELAPNGKFTILIYDDYFEDSIVHHTADCPFGINDMDQSPTETSNDDANSHYEEDKTIKTNGNNSNSDDEIIKTTKLKCKNDLAATKSTTTNPNLTSTTKRSIRKKLIESNGPSEASELIVVSDEFLSKALNQNIVIDSKQNILKMISESQQQKSIKTIHQQTTIDITSAAIDKSIVSDSIESFEANAILKSTKSISKSMDNLSQQSFDGYQLDDVGSVELVFISDEFLNKANNPKRDIIIVNSQSSPYPPRLYSSMKMKSNSQTTKKKLTNRNLMRRKCSLPTTTTTTTRKTSAQTVHSNLIRQQATEIIEITDEYQMNSMQSNDDPLKREREMKMKRNSSQESSVDDVNNKMTSHAFHSYDEEHGDLENKELQQTDL